MKQTKSMQNKKETYIALIRDGAVRDVQVCTNEQWDHCDDDSWQDYDGAEIYLGMFDGSDALEKAAEGTGIAPGNIRLVNIGENK